MTNKVRFDTAPRLWFVGQFPPPLSGQSHYNITLRDYLQGQVDLTCLTTGGNIWGKLQAALVNPWKIMTQVRRDDTVYTSAPGQRGMWLFLIVIAVLRLRGLTHFVHHHSFRSINLAPIASHRCLALIGGANSRHVFLSENMRDRYAEAYLSPAQIQGTLVVPNAFLFAQEITEPPQRDGPVTIGHLSVMTREKGLDYMLCLIERLLPETTYRFVLGGPIHDKELRTEVEAIVTAYPDRVEWLGPVQGAQKAAFYARTDLFVLPSRLIDEADPLVLLEAFAAGVPALASNRGCIPDRIMEPEHLMEMTLEPDTERLMALADAIAEDRAGWSARTQDHARRLFADAREQGRAFLKELGSDRDV